MKQSVVEKTLVPEKTWRRQNDSPSVWIAFSCGSVILHLLAFWLISLDQLNSSQRRSQSAIPIEFIESPQKSSPVQPKVKPKPKPALPKPANTRTTTTQAAKPIVPQSQPPESAIAVKPPITTNDRDAIAFDNQKIERQIQQQLAQQQAQQREADQAQRQQREFEQQREAEQQSQQQAEQREAEQQRQQREFEQQLAQQAQQREADQAQRQQQAEQRRQQQAEQREADQAQRQQQAEQRRQQQAEQREADQAQRQQLAQQRRQQQAQQREADQAQRQQAEQQRRLAQQSKSEAEEQIQQEIQRQQEAEQQIQNPPDGEKIADAPTDARGLTPEQREKAPQAAIQNQPTQSGGILTASWKIEPEQLQQNIPDNFAKPLKRTNSNDIPLPLPEDGNFQPGDFLVWLTIDDQGNLLLIKVDEAVPVEQRSQYQKYAEKIFNGQKFIPASENNGNKPPLSILPIRINIQSSSN